VVAVTLKNAPFVPQLHGSRAAYRLWSIRAGAGRYTVSAVTVSCGVTTARAARPPPAPAPGPPAGRCGAAFGDDLTQRLEAGRARAVG